MKVNGEEVPVEIVEENSEEGTVKLKVEVDKVDADMACYYLRWSNGKRC